MRAAPITALLLVCFLSIPARSLAIFEVRARYEFDGAVIAASLPNNDFKQYTGQHTTVSVRAEALAVASESKDIVLAADGRVYNGFASLGGQIEAQGGTGILRAGFNLDFLAENRVVLGTDIPNVATVALRLARVTASWRETTTMTEPALPYGFPLLVFERLDVNGALNSSVTGDDCCARALTGVTISDAAAI